MQHEGRILSVGVHGYQKRYDPEKYYVYILKLERANQPDPVYMFRSYKEFCEFHQKLCILFPLAKCYRYVVFCSSYLLPYFMYYLYLSILYTLPRLTR